MSSNLVKASSKDGYALPISRASSKLESIKPQSLPQPLLTPLQEPNIQILRPLSRSNNASTTASTSAKALPVMSARPVIYSREKNNIMDQKNPIATVRTMTPILSVPNKANANNNQIVGGKLNLSKNA